MAVKGFDHVTEYDAAITQYLSNDKLKFTEDIITKDLQS